MVDDSDKNKGFFKSTLTPLSLGELFSRKTNQEDKETFYKIEYFKSHFAIDPQFYPDFFTYYRGKVIIKEDVVLRKTPEIYRGHLTEGMNEELIIKKVQQRFEVYNPLILPTIAEETTQEHYKLRLPVPIDEQNRALTQIKAAQFERTWIAFSVDRETLDIEMEQDLKEGIVFIRMGENTGNIDYMPEEGRGGIMPKPESFVQGKPFVLNEDGSVDKTKLATKDDLQSFWRGPVKTVSGEVLEVGVVSYNSQGQ